MQTRVMIPCTSGANSTAREHGLWRKRTPWPPRPTRTGFHPPTRRANTTARRVPHDWSHYLHRRRRNTGKPHRDESVSEPLSLVVAPSLIIAPPLWSLSLPLVAVIGPRSFQERVPALPGMPTRRLALRKPGNERLASQGPTTTRLALSPSAAGTRGALLVSPTPSPLLQARFDRMPNRGTLFAASAAETLQARNPAAPRTCEPTPFAARPLTLLHILHRYMTLCLVRSQERILPPSPAARAANAAKPPRQRTLKLAPVGGVPTRGFPPARAPPIVLTARGAPAPPAPPGAPPAHSGAAAGVLPPTIIDADGRFQERCPPRCPTSALGVRSCNPTP